MRGRAQDAELSVFRDLEKFFRVMGYYEGQDVKPLEVHEHFVQKSLEANLRNSDTYIRRLQYELHMQEAKCQNRVVFQTEKPETTLLYSLFSEGIQSLVVLRELYAVEIKDWCQLIRQTLIEFDEGSTQDLASVLWRTPFRDLRARVYHSLMEMEQMLPASSSDEASTKKKNWHERDQEWDSPSAENVERHISASKPVAPQEIKNLKEKLQSLEVAAHLPAALRLLPEEVSMLSLELSAYDQNQTDYNLLLWIFALLPTLSEPDPALEGRLKTTTQSIVGRFQPSLILFILDQIQGFRNGRLESLGLSLEKTITETLLRPEIERSLIASLQDPERAKVSKSLLPLLDSKQFHSIVDFYLQSKDTDGLTEFLKVIVARDLPHEKIFFSWGDDRLSAVIPLFRRLQWPSKYEFLQRALRSPYPKIRKQSAFYIINIQMEASSALSLFESMDSDAKETWIQSLREHPPAEHWKKFIALSFQKMSWGEKLSKPLKEKLLSQFTELAFKYFREQSFRLFEAWLAPRKWFFWALNSETREIILNMLLQIPEARRLTEFKTLAAREAALLFQNSELKNRLGQVR